MPELIQAMQLVAGAPGDVAHHQADHVGSKSPTAAVKKQCRLIKALLLHQLLLPMRQLSLDAVINDSRHRHATFLAGLLAIDA